MVNKSDEEKLMEIKETNQELPEQLKDTKQIKTTVKNMSAIIQEKLMQLNDLATLEVMLDTSVRMKKRLESIKKMSSAESIKVRGHWKTTSPSMYIKGLEGRKINNDEYEISFGVYETDEKGNKKLFNHYAEVELNNGDRVKRVVSAEYRIAYEVTERIKTGKPITREVIKIDLLKEEEK